MYVQAFSLDDVPDQVSGPERPPVTNHMPQLKFQNRQIAHGVATNPESIARRGVLSDLPWYVLLAALPKMGFVDHKVLNACWSTRQRNWT